MDRDRRFDRVKRAYDAIVHGIGERADDAVAAVRARYEAGETDEFIQPIVIGDPAHGRIRAGDTAICFNFRPDRVRELVRALVDPGFEEFDRGPEPPLPFLVQMTEYAEDIHAPVAFASESLTDVLASTLAAAGIAQVHAAETEKYAHVTYFFDGGSEHRQPGETWELVASRRDVPTYDKAPGMSAEGVAERFCDRMAAPEVGFGLVNFANPDMVGHTGVIAAAVEAVQTTDRCLARVVETVEGRGGVCLVTADHGNAEVMLNADGSPNTAHTTNPVPFIATRHGLELRSGGRLADVAPTVLGLLGVAQPDVMNGRSLISLVGATLRCGRRYRSPPAPCGRMSILAMVLVTRLSPLGTSAARPRRPPTRPQGRRACVRAHRAPVPDAALQLRRARPERRPGAGGGSVPGGVPARLPGPAGV